MKEVEDYAKYFSNVLSATPMPARWTERVRVLPRGLTLNPPRIGPEVQSVVYESLSQERQIRIHYRSKGESEFQGYVVNPLGIVVRDRVIYLVCTLWDYEDTLQLALHRITDAILTDEEAMRPDSFDLDAYIRKGEFGYPVTDARIRLRARHRSRLDPDEGSA